MSSYGVFCGLHNPTQSHLPLRPPCLSSVQRLACGEGVQSTGLDHNGKFPEKTQHYYQQLPSVSRIKKFEEYWEAFSKDCMSHVRLFVHLVGIAILSRKMLQGDYLGISRQVEYDFELDMVTLIHAQRSDVGDDEYKRRYREDVLIPQRVMAVDMDGLLGGQVVVDSRWALKSYWPVSEMSRDMRTYDYPRITFPGNGEPGLGDTGSTHVRGR